MFLFKEEHVPMIVAGVPRLKTQTRRLHKRRRAVPGSLHWAQRGMKADTRFARLTVTRAWQEYLFDISNADVLAEGYSSCDEYFAVFRAINGISDVAAEYFNAYVWCYEFECIDVTPVGHAITARLNCFGLLTR